MVLIQFDCGPKYCGSNEGSGGCIIEVSRGIRGLVNVVREYVGRILSSRDKIRNASEVYVAAYHMGVHRLVHFFHPCGQVVHLGREGCRNFAILERSMDAKHSSSSPAVAYQDIGVQ